MEQIHAGNLLEQFAGEMLGGGKARAREHDLARIGLGGLDQLFHIVGGKIRPRHDQKARARDLRHRRQCGGVVRHVLARHRGDDLARGHDAERVAVGRGVRDQLIAEDAAGARLVLDDDRLAEPLLHGVGEDAADDVGAAAGAERDDDMDRLRRPVLRRRGLCGCDQAQRRGERQHLLFHESSLRRKYSSKAT